MTDNSIRPWSRANVSPSDWLGILAVDLQEKRLPATNIGLVAWLSRHGAATEASTISRLRKKVRCEEVLSPRLEAIIQTIIENVSPRSCIIYFEELCYRSLKFFNPHGNIDQKNERHHLPLGVYQATRYSFSDPGKLMRSAFLFYRNREKDERLSGYGDNLSVAAAYNQSSVLRFREVRVIEEGSKPKYQILVGGFAFYNHNCFYLIGSGLETNPGVQERQLRMSDIRHVQMSYYVLDDDNDADRIRGMKVTGLRKKGDPSAAVLELERIHNADVSKANWHEILDSKYLEVGVREMDKVAPNGKTYAHNYADRLQVHDDEEFHQLRVTTFPSTY